MSRGSIPRVPLTQFAVTALSARRGRPFLGEQWVIFPSTAGALRDPNNFGKQWRKAQDELDALPRKDRGLNLHPYRGLHVARYPMAAIPAEADCPLILADRPARIGRGHEPKVSE